MSKYIAIEPNSCIGCGTCLAACSQGHRVAGLQAEPRLAMAGTYEVTAAVTCHHCEGAPCLAVCPVNAISRVNGAVVVNEQTCVGCRLCACACPFGAIHPAGTPIAGVAGVSCETPTFPRGTSALLTWEIGVYTCAVKCDMCAYDPAGTPHCVDACLTGALSVHEEPDQNQARKDKMRAAAQANEVMMRGVSTIRRP